MTTRLPEGANLENLKKQARTLLKASRSGDFQARRRVEKLFRGKGDLGINEAQLVLARENGFDSWRKLRAGVLAQAGKVSRRDIWQYMVSVVGDCMRSHADEVHFTKTPPNSCAVHLKVEGKLVEHSAPPVSLWEATKASLIHEETGIIEYRFEPSQTAGFAVVSHTENSLVIRLTGTSSEPEQASTVEEGEDWVGILFLNDETTPMPFVVEILESVFNHNRDDAVQAMVRVHTHRAAVVGLVHVNLAERIIQDIMSRAEHAGFPFQCRVASEAETRRYVSELPAV